MDVRVLGPLELRCGGAVLALGAPKQKTALALLLARLNSAVQFGELVQELWGERPPVSAAQNLRMYVNRLARTLGALPDGPRLSRHAAGYTLAVPEAAVDLYRFRGCVRRGRQAAAGGDLQAAVAEFDAGVGLWRGQPVEDVRVGPILTAWRTAVQEERLCAVEDRAEALLALGRHDRVAADARELLSTAPLRERAHALLIRALYHGGDTAAALVAFDVARRSLDEQLGVQPGEELRRLHRVILNRPPPPAPPAAAAPPTQPAAVVPRQLPAGVAGFTGRAVRLRQLDLLLADGTAPTVVISAIAGTGGVGKTAFAVHWAHRVADRFPDGQLYLNLRGYDPTSSPMTSAEAVRTFLDAFHIPPQRIPAADDAQTALYRSLLAGKRILVLLDNARNAEQVRPLLPGTPGCLVLVTSRNQLTGLVAADGAHPLTLDVLTTAEARELLTRRLGPHRTTAEPHATQQIIDRCAHLPLALVIAAAHAATHPHTPLADLAKQLHQASARLDTLAGDDPATDLRAVFNCSYQALSPAAARLFRLLGRHPGPDITIPTAASLTALPPTQVSPLVTELTRNHLLTEHTTDRYTLHDLLRTYTHELTHTHHTHTDLHAATRRILDHYLHTAHTAALKLQPHWDPVRPARPVAGVTPEDLADHDQAMAWFTAEHQALVACVETAADQGFEAHAWQLAGACTRFFQPRVHWHDWAAVHRIALAAAERAGDETGQAHAHHDLGRAYVRLGRYGDAHRHLHRALHLLRRLGDQAGQAHSHFNLSQLCDVQGRGQEAFEHDRQALELYRAAHYRPGEADALNALGWDHAQRGEYPQALEHCQQAQDIHRELHDRYGEATTWDSLGYVHRQLGNHGEATACYERAVALRREIGDRFLEARSLTGLGHAYLSAGTADAARDAWRRAVEILHEVDHPDTHGLVAELRKLNDLHPA